MAGRKPDTGKYGKVLLVGSGPIKIGEAAEFDYSGSQALKALHEEGIETIIVNSNVATVQTSYASADHVYLLPVKKRFIEKVIEKEKPSGIFIGFGGQSALNAGIDLNNSGVLKKHKVKIFGTSLTGIKAALGRADFKRLMESKGIRTAPSMSATTESEALSAADTLRYPVMVRVSFNLAGRGSFIAKSRAAMEKGIKRAFAQSKTGEVLIEKYLSGWKEIEYEVVRDKYGNAAVVACIENLDPMGVHTGESTVVTPAQTLDNEDYNAMRTVSIRVAEAIDLVGECNVQFALNPSNREFYVIETNPRMSRSSALASKATGYPLAYVSAKLGLGYKLYEVMNEVSKATSAFFEPSLDYITVKIPRWDLTKFDSSNSGLGTEMKSIGEVMAIGRSFEESMQKAVRMLDIGEPGLVGGKVYNSSMNKEEITAALKSRKPYWFLYAAKAFSIGMSVEELHKLTGVDNFFLGKVADLVMLYEKARTKRTAFAKGTEAYHRLCRMGFCERQLGIKQDTYVKSIDTLAGEWPAKVNYLYTTHTASSDDIKFKKGGRKALVLGAGVFRIGVSVEFDWSSVSFARALKKSFSEVSMLNYNPETVSTDWDTADKLYFDELSAETVKAIYRKEHFDGVAVFTGGQIGNNIAGELAKSGIKFIGTGAKSIDRSEDRNSFSAIVEKLGLAQPEWCTASNMHDVKAFIDSVGFPILARPSYILSGSSFKLIHSIDELENYIRLVQNSSHRTAMILTKFYSDSIEAEMDCVTDSKSVVGIGMQHIEEAGVHSGDATIATPFHESDKIYKDMKNTALLLSNELEMKGPFNIQFLISNGKVYIIELNSRASRSMPFSSKSVGINLMDYAYKAIFKGLGISGRFYEPRHSSYMVKSPQFSWLQLKDAYPVLGPEMRSTGESAAFGDTLGEALLNSWLGVNPNHIPTKPAIIYGESSIKQLSAAAKTIGKQLDAYTISDYAVEGAEQISKAKALEKIGNNDIGIVMTDNDMSKRDFDLRRRTVDLNIPLVLNGRLAARLAEAFAEADKYKEVREMKEYY
ncbi:carbamoylphosphate synthetase [mine drainage metagenome]|uniref:Carbamoylphosphate synthetase n=4 Tax=mine drainage metagenome TaxID=410659 RepID=T0Y2M0_9ZZZZ